MNLVGLALFYASPTRFSTMDSAQSGCVAKMGTVPWIFSTLTHFIRFARTYVTCYPGGPALPLTDPSVARVRPR
jgi:hypothetical protein